MKFQITNRFTGAVQYECELDAEVAGQSYSLQLGFAVRKGMAARTYLARTYLAGAYLADANLAGAYLAGANLAGANLAGAYLAGANLAGANLAGANLADANLAGANLAGAYLADAYLADANLAGANLADAYLADANLADANGTKLTLVGKRPMTTYGPFGSRCDILTAFTTDHGVYVRAGCFWNTLDAFKAAVEKEHGDSVHGREYRALIAVIELHAKEWPDDTRGELP